MTGFSCFVVGEGVLVLSCLEVLSEQGCLIRAACSTDRTVQAWATENNVICTEDPAIFEQQILCSEYDYLFSINNIQWVISAAVIGRAGTATINYHDAPLPQQPRLQTTTWGASHLYAEVDRPHPKSLSLRERDFESGSLLPEGEGLGMRASNPRTSANQPPQPGAKLGRDRQGNPAWFIPDPDRAGKYLQVGNHE